MSRLLEGKIAIIYGGGGGLGAGVARTFAREGARVFLAGRTGEPLDAVAGEITAAGGQADVSVVDATDERAVETQLRDVVDKAGRVDVSFNLISRPHSGGPRLENVAEVATFLASDRAAGITGTMTNVTSGLVLR